MKPVSHHAVALALFTAFLAGRLSATDWYVSGLRGNDANAGTQAQPFKTITKGLTVALPNDRVLVLEGRYAPSTGEQLPLTIPIGVDLIGVDARTCVIDVEYDPTRVANPYTGSPVVRVLSNSRFAHFGLIHGPRDLTAPYFGQWWKIMILVQDTNGNAQDVELDHLVIDECTRPLVVGSSTGDHNIKNVLIHDCVVSRFYSEGMNSWVGNGTASGNIIYNCTVVGHMDTTTGRPVPRDGLLFGKNTKFDVRNSIVMQAQYSAIGADSAATITSDYNCLWGGGNTTMPGYRGGVTGGTNDLIADPQIGALPTATAPIDPHLSSSNSPAWNSGLAQPGQMSQTDIDLGNARIFAGRVDRGADEYLPFDAYVTGIPRPGDTVALGVVGRAQSAALTALGFAKLPSGVNVPGFAGQLWLDPSLPILFGIVIKDTRGWGATSLPFPNIASLTGLDLYLQGIEIGTSSFSDLDAVKLIN